MANPGSQGSPRRPRHALVRTLEALRRNRAGLVGLTLLAVFIIVSLVGPWLVDPANLDPAAADAPAFQPPSAIYPLGTDKWGRPILGLLIAGARISLVVGLAATVGATLIGAGVGITAGYFGGRWIDGVLNGVTNWFLVLPWVPLAIALASVLGRNLTTIILVIALTSWAGTARIVRAQTLSVRERSFVERARALGAGHGRIMRRHILPNVMPVIVANAVLTVALSILSETTLSILGLGDPNALSWGRIIEEAFRNGALTAGWWWWLLPPGFAIVLVTLAFTMCAHALDEVFDPRLRDR